MQDKVTFWMSYFFGVCLAVWLGSMIFFAAVAQIPFQMLPSRHIAGNITSAMLARIDQSGPFLGVLLALLCVIIARRLGCATKEFAPLVVLLLVMVLIPVISGQMLTPRLFSIRGSAPGGIIDNALATDPIRIAFNRLHVWSVSLLLLNILLGFVSFGLAFKLFFTRARTE